MTSDTFWATIDAQLKEASTAGTADDVLRIFATARNPYGDPHISGITYVEGDLYRGTDR
jgi:hypothetical protein